MRAEGSQDPRNEAKVFSFLFLKITLNKAWTQVLDLLDQDWKVRSWRDCVCFCRNCISVLIKAPPHIRATRNVARQRLYWLHRVRRSMGKQWGWLQLWALNHPKKALLENSPQRQGRRTFRKHPAVLSQKCDNSLPEPHSWRKKIKESNNKVHFLLHHPRVRETSRTRKYPPCLKASCTGCNGHYLELVEICAMEHHIANCEHTCIAIVIIIYR